MVNFISSERFRLELRWSKAIYNSPGECILEGAYFVGPVLQIAEKVKPNDNIMLDFYSQYVTLVKGVYVAKFSWSAVIYSDDGLKVYLKDAVMSHAAELNNVPSLVDTDYFIIDTSDHTFDKHKFHLVYKTILVNADDNLYRFAK